MKKIVIPVTAVLILLIMVAWLAGSFNTKVTPGINKTASDISTSEFFTVKSEKKAVFENVSASVTAKQATIISSRLLARIDKINVRSGDKVQQGDILISLEHKDLASSVVESQERVNAMLARHTEAEQNYNRATELYEKKIASKYDLDKSFADYQTSKAELTAAQQNLNQANTSLSYATLRAPITGTIVDRFAEPGNTAQPGTKLLSLYNPLSLRVEAQVREELALTLILGQPIKINLPSVEKIITGHIEEIVPAANTGSRSFLIKVSLPYQESLLPGMYARVLIPAGEAEFIEVPNNAISHLGQLSFVQVLVDGNIQRRYVRLGVKNSTEMSKLISGLYIGEKIQLN